MNEFYCMHDKWQSTVAYLNRGGGPLNLDWTNLHILNNNFAKTFPVISQLKFFIQVKVEITVQRYKKELIYKHKSDIHKFTKVK